MNIEGLIDFVRLAAINFEDYLDTEVLFYPLAGHSELQLSIGAVLDSIWQLRAVSLTQAQRTVLEVAESKIRAVRADHVPSYERKAVREFKSRLDAWTWYLDDMGDSSVQYANQVLQRVKIELLTQDVRQPEDMLRILHGLDARLQSKLKPAPFVLSSELQHAAPASTNWWLYGLPK